MQSSSINLNKDIVRASSMTTERILESQTLEAQAISLIGRSNESSFSGTQEGLKIATSNRSEKIEQNTARKEFSFKGLGELLGTMTHSSKRLQNSLMV
ncbi:17841_t:CDS:2 [Gigaspora margarita]|uniref:17841_t:CDS:1 n=1 Tax=Gigaspora margarita TaxID=4874 RepID=A0ABN7V3S3_GIGMA|nr:17841_t:CDS:2 [Gigaspora margarita]